MVTNPLTQAREAVADALRAAGLTAYDYVQESFTPPVCLVVPDATYVTAPVGVNPFRAPYAINLQVMVIGSKGTNKTAATQIDSMLVTVINTLDEDWDITEVQAPIEVSIKGVSYMGSLVTLTTNTSLEMEVI